MTDRELEQALSAEIGGAVSVEPGINGARQVHTPFRFGDGDELVIHLRDLGNDRFEWSDTGHTFMHLSYWLDVDAIESGNRARILDEHLQQFEAEERDGELVLGAPRPELGRSLFRFAQLLLHVSDLDFLSRDVVRSTFLEDFTILLSEEFQERALFDYVDPDRDPHAHYPVDCLVNGIDRPLAIFALSNDSRCRDATITLHQFREWGRELFSAGVFEDQEEINRKVLARFSDACDKQFSALMGNEEAIVNYLRRELER